jgi:hypothetical protein
MMKALVERATPTCHSEISPGSLHIYEAASAYRVPDKVPRRSLGKVSHGAESGWVVLMLDHFGECAAAFLTFYLRSVEFEQRSSVLRA